jgi:dihydrofolate reductase
MIISLIAVVDEQLGLGKDNGLLCHLPADLQHFKSLTLNKPIIMGRNTFASIGKPLPGRHNIVLTHQHLVIEGVSIANSLEAALDLAKNQSEVMIIGGASIYKQALGIAQRIYLTRIHHRFEADVFFPSLCSAEWKLQKEVFRTSDDRNCYDLTFSEYLRVVAE